MNKKEQTKDRYSVLEGNPTREERLATLLEGKVIRVETYRIMYYKLDRYHRLCFSYTGHKSSFQPFYNAYDYSDVLDDYDWAGNQEKVLTII